MQLIRKLGTRLNKNGTKQSWAVFWCAFCKSEVERYLYNGLNSKSCGCIKVELTSNYNRGRKHSEEHKQKISLANRGKIRTEEQRKKYSEALKGHAVAEETKQKLRQYKGILASQWQNGISFEPYSPEFNKEKKRQVLERDNYTCRNPNCEHKTDSLDIHHIDYDKKNNSLENLTTLCDSCHSKTNHGNRVYWIKYYQNIIIERN